MPEELFDICDRRDRVIGTLPRSEVHRRGLPHRAVSVFVVRPDGRLLVHRRALTKDESPGLWTGSATGHVSAGEDYDTAAGRELAEELGLTGPLERLHTFPASAETAHEFTALYRLVTDADPVPDPGEIAEVAWRGVDEIAADLARDRERFTVTFQVLFAWYVRDGAEKPRLLLRSRVSPKTRRRYRTNSHAT